MIRQATNPTGGLGNRLFQMNFLGQISKYLHQEFEFFSPEDAKFFANVKDKKMPLSNRFNKTLDIDEALLYQKELRPHRNRNNLHQKYLVIRGNHLGETFYKYSYCDPREIVIPKFSIEQKFTRIACHFRGGDFANWNPSAILKAEYYLNSIAYVDSLLNEQLPILLVTDDENLEAYNVVKSEHKNRILQNPGMGYIADFQHLARSEYLISSPSTFAIWAGILGRNKLIIHNQEWVSDRADAKDPFWASLQNGGNDFYKASYFL